MTADSTVAWRLQQLREVLGLDHPYQFLLHDRDCIFSRELDESIEALGISVLRSAPHSPNMNAICERARDRNVTQGVSRRAGAAV